MHYALSASRGFVIDHGRVLEHSPFVHVAIEQPAGDESVVVPALVIVEPVERAYGDEAIASRIIDDMVRSLRGIRNANVAQCLNDGFQAANRSLRLENERRGLRRRIYLGMSVVLVSGSHLTIAQVPPTQILVQNSQELIQLPELDTWLGGETSETSPLPGGQPLGIRSRAFPLITHLPPESGQTVLAVSSSTARVLASHDLAEDRSAFLDDQLDRIYSFAGQEGTNRFYAGVVQTGDPVLDASLQTMHTDETGGLFADPRCNGQGEHSGTSNLDPFSIHNSLALGWSIQPAVSQSALFLSSSTTRFLEPESRAARGASASFDQAIPTARYRNRRRAGGNDIVEIFAGLLLTLTAAVVGVWRMSSRDRPIHGPRDDGTLGIPHLQHWSDGYRKPRFERIHRVSPRVEINRIVIVLCLLAVVAAAAAGVFTFVARDQDSSVVTSEEFGEVITLHAEANAASDTVATYNLLTEARNRINNLTAGMPDEQLDQRVLQERNSIVADLERLTSTTTVENAQIVGSVPPAPEGTSPHLFTGGGNVYLVADALYEVNAVDSKLVKLLGPGDIVEGGTVGQLQGGTWRNDGPLVVDSESAYIFDTSRGVWMREPLGRVPEGANPMVEAVDIFDFNLYMLDSEQGRILMYVAGDYEAEPENWTGGLAAEALQNAVDIEIDGNIYVLLRDGSILSFYLSAIENQWKPSAVPPIDSATTLVRNPGGDYFYVTNSSDGRILRINSNGELMQQFQTSPDLPSLENITDLVIDQDTNLAYAVIADSTLLTVRLPGPESASRN